MSIDKDKDELKYIFSQKAKEFSDSKVPIYRGCQNEVCYCTGACKEIIGYRDRVPGELFPIKFPIKS